MLVILITSGAGNAGSFVFNGPKKDKLIPGETISKRRIYYNGVIWSYLRTIFNQLPPEDLHPFSLPALRFSDFQCRRQRQAFLPNLLLMERTKEDECRQANSTLSIAVVYDPDLGRRNRRWPN
jgi:hypothetical protein